MRGPVVSLTLLALVTLFFNVLGHMLRKRFRQAY